MGPARQERQTRQASPRYRSGIIQVQFPFELTQHLVVDLVLGPELEQGCALDGAQLHGEISVLLVISALRDGLLLGLIFRQQVESLPVVVRQGRPRSSRRPGFFPSSMESRQASAASSMPRRARFSSAFAPLLPPIPRPRIIAGSESPCRTSVVRMTEKVRNKIKLRCGNGWPSFRIFRQRNGRGQRQHSPHASPAEEENLFGTRRLLDFWPRSRVRIQ